MCGIAGYIGNKIIDRDDINRTLKLMDNRGPDSKDFKIFQLLNIDAY